MMRWTVIGILSFMAAGGVAAGQTTAPVQRTTDAPESTLPSPRDAHHALIEGACDVSLVVDEAGMPEKIHVVHCTDKRLKDYAKASVAGYRFIPPESKGHPVSAQTMIEVSVHALAKDAFANAVSQNAADTSTGGVVADSKMPEGAYQVGGGVTAPVVIYSPEAPWPTDAKGKKVFPPGMKGSFFHKGKLTSIDAAIQIIVGKDGLAKDAKIAKPGYPEFDASALATVSTYRFKPSMKDGQPVAVRVTVEVGFTVH